VKFFVQHFLYLDRSIYLFIYVYIFISGSEAQNYLPSPTNPELILIQIDILAHSSERLSRTRGYISMTLTTLFFSNLVERIHECFPNNPNNLITH
jgi:hypothetical protein